MFHPYFTFTSAATAPAVSSSYGHKIGRKRRDDVSTEEVRQQWDLLELRKKKREAAEIQPEPIAVPALEAIEPPAIIAEQPRVALPPMPRPARAVVTPPEPEAPKGMSPEQIVAYVLAMDEDL